jgi:nitroreductase
MGVLSMDLRLGSGCTPIDVSVPYDAHPEKCIRCGHCVAVCPKEALDHSSAPLSAQVPLPEGSTLDTETAALFLRSRRSVRNYKNDPVPRNILLRLLDIARFAPSGTNTRGLSYLVVSDKERLGRATGAVVDWLEEKLTRPGSKMPAGFWAPVEEYRKGRDTLLRGAPHLILALTPPGILAVSTDSAKLALEYVELLAPTMGLGACWMGIVQLCAGRKYPPLMEALGIPEDKEVVGAITAGYPVYRYRRLVDREPLEVRWV